MVGPGAIYWNLYLYAGGEMIGLDVQSGSTHTLRYFVKDHLGSIAVITNEAGVVAERLAFDAWGKRRNPNGTDDAANILTASTTRGFTGHEMIDEVDLVNMNGRVYNPALGRFMSADPFIHDVTNSQDLNRYSYVHNNPLSFVDQNGYGFFKSIGKFFKKFWKVLLAAAVAIALQQYELIPAILPGEGATAVFVNGAISAGVRGGIASVIITGKPKAFLTGFGKGFLTFGVGHGLFPGDELGKVAFGSGEHIGRIIGHGVIQGGFTEIQGGKFSQGFLSAAFTAAAGPALPEDFWGGFAVSTIVGGAASELAGGKFSEGAATASFIYLFNEAGKKLSGPQRLRNAVLKALKLKYPNLPDQRDNIKALTFKYAKVLDRSQLNYEDWRSVPSSHDTDGSYEFGIPGYDPYVVKLYLGDEWYEPRIDTITISTVTGDALHFIGAIIAIPTKGRWGFDHAKDFGDYPLDARMNTDYIETIERVFRWPPSSQSASFFSAFRPMTLA